MFLKGEGVLKNEEVAFKYYQKAATIHRDARAWYKLGRMYEASIGTPANLEEAISCYSRAAEMKNPDAQIRLGVLSEPDTAKAMSFFEAAATNGCAEAHYRLGLLKGNIRNEWEVAFEHFQVAANQNYIPALGALGVQHLSGSGVDKDEAQGLRLLQQASQLGDPVADYHLSQIYLKGTVLPKDEARGLDLLKRSASCGDPNALYQLGILFSKGSFVEKDISQAVDYFRRAAEGGHKKAMLFLEKAVRK
jgi:TPR repeat protein